MFFYFHFYNILGFSQSLNSVTSLKKFISQEEQSNTAYLIAKLESEPICVEGYDECGVCGGNGLTCAPRGCDGVRGRFVYLFFYLFIEINFESFIFFSGKVYDKCDVCDGNNACTDCAGVPYGTTKLDACGRY